MFVYAWWVKDNIVVYAFTSVLFEVVLMMYFQNGVGLMPSVVYTNTVCFTCFSKHWCSTQTGCKANRLQDQSVIMDPKPHIFPDLISDLVENQWISSCCIAAEHLWTGFVSNTRAIHSFFKPFIRMCTQIAMLRLHLFDIIGSIFEGHDLGLHLAIRFLERT